MALNDFFKKRREEKKAKLKKAPHLTDSVHLHDLKTEHSKISDDKLSELWTKCNNCNEILYVRSLVKNQNVCKHCNYHFRLNSKERIQLLIDKNTFTEINGNILPADPLEFVDLKPYKDRLKAAKELTDSNEAIVTGLGNINGQKVAIASMEFEFIGGSMGCVVGEKIARLVEEAIAKRIPLIIVSSSGGARMHEGILSLMQMAKTASALQKLHEEGLLYFSILTEPTFGGVTASFAMLGDIIIAEPQARIGFAGRRVIEETIKQKLPKDFQTAEYLVDHGQIDTVVDRFNLKDTVSELIRLHSQSLNNQTFTKLTRPKDEKSNLNNGNNVYLRV